MTIKAFYKKTDDPLATRISCGSSGDDAYIVYRGNLEDVKETVRAIHEFLQNQTEEAEADPRDLLIN